MTASVTLWLTIGSGATNLGVGDEMWHRTIYTSFLPVKGDWIYTSLADEEDGDYDCAGFRLTVRNRYMGATGHWNVELTRVVVDPSEEVAASIQANIANGHDDWTIYWTGNEGSIEKRKEQLLAIGWKLR